MILETLDPPLITYQTDRRGGSRREGISVRIGGGAFYRVDVQRGGFIPELGSSLMSGRTKHSNCKYLKKKFNILRSDISQ